MILPRLHIVTDDDVLAGTGFLDDAVAVLERGRTDIALHLRGHRTRGARLHELGVHLAAAALRSGSWLLVNDRVDVAMAVRANGVQLGASSMPLDGARALLGRGARIGYSAHGTLEAVQSAVDGADFVLMGTIYASPSHPDRSAAGLVALRDCVARAGVPVVAIGGITPERVAPVLTRGAHGIAVLSGVWEAEDPGAAAAAFVAALAEAGSEQQMEAE
jgi:thiamine-phosphate diphosphorylase